LALQLCNILVVGIVGTIGVAGIAEVGPHTRENVLIKGINEEYLSDVCGKLDRTPELAVVTAAGIFLCTARLVGE
jgi:hypothetical protein